MYNSEAFISETINSVINQTYKNWELLLIDDASEDNTLQAIQPFLDSYSNIKLIKTKEILGLLFQGIKELKLQKEII